MAAATTAGVVSILFFLSTFLAFANSVVDVSGNSLNFLSIGDWGGTPDKPYYTVGQSKVASVMGEKAQEINSQFTVAVGDNFYEDGVKDVDDPRFNETFEVSGALSPPPHPINPFACRTCSLLRLFRNVGMLYVATMTTMVMHRHRLHTRKSQLDGTCLVFTTLR